METLKNWISNHKRDTGAALGGLAAALHAVGEIWGIDAPWYGKTLATLTYLGGTFAAIGFGHAWLKSADTLPSDP